ncbi:hypothetical protein [Nocardiopsis nanhaiensis]
MANPEQRGLRPVIHSAGVDRLRVSRLVNVRGEITSGSKIISMLEHICPLFLKMHKRAEDSFPGGLFPGKEKAGLGGWVSVV